MKLFTEVTPRQIRGLDEHQLTELMKSLLLLEAESNGIARRAVDVSLSITVPDGGEDGRVEWVSEPAHTNYFPTKLCLFQAKATKFEVHHVKGELMLPQNKGGGLKPQFVDLFDRGGAYILLNSKNLAPPKRKSLITEIRKNLAESGRLDSESAIVHVYDENKIAQWCNCFPALVMGVHQASRMAIPAGIQTWEDLARRREFSSNYFIDEAVQPIFQAIYSASTRTGSHYRLVGLAGLGKTRLVFEAFRPWSQDATNEVESLRRSLLYFSASEGIGNIVESVRLIVQIKRRAVVVVDDCESELATNLEREISKTDSAVSLVTIGHPTEDNDRDVALRPEYLGDMVLKMLTYAYPGLDESTIRRIAELAGGFPQMAYLLAEAQIGDQQTLGPITNHSLMNRILWGLKSPNPVEQRALGALAMFTYMGFRDGVETDRKTVGRLMTTDPESFYKILKRHIKRGIVQQYGRMVKIRPEPLAFALCENWLSDTPLDQIIAIVEQLDQVGLFDRMLERLRRLHYPEDSLKLCETLCRPDGLIGCKDKLATESGLRRLSLLAEVVPKMALAAMENVFSEWGVTEWQERSELIANAADVYAKLCWWGDTFERASLLFLRLVLGAARGGHKDLQEQFTALFRYALSGTQARPAVRWRVLEQALVSPSEDEQLLGALGLLKAVHWGYAMRIGGVECQGSRKPQLDWQIRRGSQDDYDEYVEYWKKACNKLTEIACCDSTMAKTVREKLGEQLGDIIRSRIGENDGFRTLDHVVRTIGKKHQGYWPKAAESLHHLLFFSGDTLSSEVRELVRGWLSILSPTRIDDRIDALLINPIRRPLRNSEGVHKDGVCEDAALFAQELAEAPADLRVYYDAFARADARVAYTFGKRLGEVVNAPEELLASYINYLEGHGERQLSGVLVGLLAALEEGRQRIFVSRLRESKTMLSQVPSLLGHLKNFGEFLDELIDDVVSGRMPIHSLGEIEFTSGFCSLPEGKIAEMVKRLVPLGPVAAALCLRLLSSYCIHPESRWTSLLPELRTVISCPGLFRTISIREFHEVGAFVDALTRVIRDDPESNTLAAQIAEEIMVATKERYMSYAIAQYAESSLLFLLSCRPDQTWTIIGREILSSSDYNESNLSHVFCSKCDDDGSDGDPLVSQVPEQLLFSWCASNAPLGPRKIAAITPAFTVSNKMGQWTRVAQHLIDNYGRDSHVLERLNTRLHYRSWWGSEVPGCELRRDLYLKLLNHDLHEVRTWAQQMVDAYDGQIDYALQREAEERVRYGE